MSKNTTATKKDIKSDSKVTIDISKEQLESIKDFLKDVLQNDKFVTLCLNLESASLCVVDMAVILLWQHISRYGNENYSEDQLKLLKSPNAVTIIHSLLRDCVDVTLDKHYEELKQGNIHLSENFLKFKCAYDAFVDAIMAESKQEDENAKEEVAQTDDKSPVENVTNTDSPQ